MKLRFAILFALSFLILSSVCAQNSNRISLQFVTLFNQSVLNLRDSVYTINDSNQVQFDNLKFYISGIELWNQSKRVWKEPNSFHLVDFSDSNSLKLMLNPDRELNFSRIKFTLGIDSITHESGAFGGALDPTKGMYWTWQSGYINFKLEGKFMQSKSINNDFEYHLGGYRYPFNTLQNIALNTTGKKNLSIEFHLKQLLDEVNIAETKRIMSPGKEAVRLSKALVKCFKIRE